VAVFFESFYSVGCVLGDVAEVVEDEPVLVGGDDSCEDVFVSVTSPE